MTAKALEREDVSRKRHKKMKYMQKPQSLSTFLYGKQDSSFQLTVCYFVRLYLCNRFLICRLSAICAVFFRTSDYGVSIIQVFNLCLFNHTVYLIIHVKCG